MAARWSNPSGGIGVHRFRVWPAGTDSYNHTELTSNFDLVDAIVGQPSDASAWPPSTGLNGGIYKEIRLLQLDRPAIGTVFAWFRPTVDVPIPDGCLPCDGSIVSASDHDFPGVATSITLPDLRNAFILGADPDLALNTPAVVVTNGNLDSHLGAPGPNANGGSHKIVQTVSQLASHSHSLNDPGHAHALSDPTHAHPVGDPGHVHTISVAIQGSGDGSTSSSISQGRAEITDHAADMPMTNISASLGTAATGISLGNAVTGITMSPATTGMGMFNIGNGDPMDNRPRYVGLIYLCRVRYADSI